MYKTNQYESFAALSVIRYERSVQVIWRIRSEFHYKTTWLYRHSDGTWHMDPDSAKRGALFASLIRDAIVSHPKQTPVKESMYRDVKGSGDVGKMEYNRKLDDMYRAQQKEALARQMLANGEINALPAKVRKGHREE